MTSRACLGKLLHKYEYCLFIPKIYFLRFVYNPAAMTRGSFLLLLEKTRHDCQCPCHPRGGGSFYIIMQKLPPGGAFSNSCRGLHSLAAR